jgi:NAD(P)-dependent dehydrogenase (short-subunit alcohol dehydrogenase family)
VTGAAGGFGRALVKAFMESGTSRAVGEILKQCWTESAMVERDLKHHLGRATSHG